jgi:hypothetical protein
MMNGLKRSGVRLPSKRRQVLQTIREDEEMCMDSQEAQPLMWSFYHAKTPWWMACWDACSGCLDADCFLSFEY